MMSPRASAKPRRYALPYPRRRSRITWAPASVASSADRSVDPLSTTRTSPELPEADNQARALATQTATVSASLRQGMTIEMRGARAAVIGEPPECRCGERVGIDSLGRGCAAGSPRSRWCALRRARGTSRAVAVLVGHDVAVAEVRRERVPRDIDLVEASIA